MTFFSRAKPIWNPQPPNLPLPNPSYYEHQIQTHLRSHNEHQIQIKISERGKSEQIDKQKNTIEKTTIPSRWESGMLFNLPFPSHTKLELLLLKSMFWLAPDFSIRSGFICAEQNPRYTQVDVEFFGMNFEDFKGIRGNFDVGVEGTRGKSRRKFQLGKVKQWWLRGGVMGYGKKIKNEKL